MCLLCAVAILVPHGQTLSFVLKCQLIISYKHQPGQLLEVKIEPGGDLKNGTGYKTLLIRPWGVKVPG